MDKQIRVAVAGANGRMGQEVVKMLAQDAQLIYTGNLDTRLGSEEINKQMEEMKPDVLVDFTTPHSVYKNMELCLAHGVRPVVGTTGLTPEQLQEMTDRYKEAGLGAIIAPNFAIGAILCMKFAAMAAKYMPHVEIIELHHDRKLDAPSGTALKTAEMIAAVRQELKQGHPEEAETIPGARGAEYEGFRIHSVRLPGMVAHQEVLFGSTGQTLSIRHDSINRESFMPGVNLAIKAVMSMYGLIYGLEHLID
ncbi:4-hydroxy-tetrahydrodipicolinate reductase [Brevibacillus agri]|uniref:4-hydroxy-tetrahydrodipicolinate reductase n=1 Tax=Brevibacillus agri TaxID=51101 RepID=A0A3M8AQP6_9BACL|nr:MULTISPECIES: 4-hydroxy-tetrahydrodipicolinate reductase [Brevibacillus]ELK41634.1 dihydrodipicolinate reductase [Brevibacillus agri BAB-2500]EJL40889.1 dihydrodipicolinate reductase [Brevibacillus sp. CF112]MBG9568673.1 dihydrodipicolinate reductase [Brevibacillus agri]MBY0050368.1 4-hydroxy-tetrahydrodipicolinate reductase [Brevibacillus agri]MCG5250045.1 4-hydroxy-tetrahydrodipicolinate reductase [Brevibacillus agri]